jgi:DNA repair exonuclease SbcCD ATPase subunit
MKKVIIKRLSLLNFKGLREFQIEFNDSMTSVLGKNGSGKTTIFDAFTWLLFGKDSEDRKSFNIKTLDAQAWLSLAFRLRYRYHDGR